MTRGSDEADGNRPGEVEVGVGGETVTRGGLTHKNLDIWKLGIDIVESIYKTTSLFPRNEYGLTSDMRRAAVSVPSNIAEGAARNSGKEFLHFLYVSLGSLSELETQVIIADRLGYIDNPRNLLELIEKERRKLLKYIKYRKEKA